MPSFESKKKVSRSSSDSEILEYSVSRNDLIEEKCQKNVHNLNIPNTNIPKNLKIN